MDALLEQPPQVLVGGLVVILVVLYLALGRSSTPRGGKKRAKPQSKVFAKDPKDGTSIYRALGKDGKPIPELVDSFYGLHTLYEGFQRGVSISGDGNCLGTRQGESPFGWISYNKVNERATNLGSALVNIGLNPGESMIGVYSQNRAEWCITEQAANAYSLTLVPLYETLGADAVEYVVNLCELQVIVCSADKIPNMLEVAQTKNSTITHVISMDPVDKKVVQEGAEVNVTILYMNDMETEGKNNPQDHVPPSADQVATICFTSGTTGNPKGVMLTHGNMIADAAGIVATGFNFETSDVHISYLPLAHMFERVVQCGLFMHGAQIGFFRGDIKKLFDDIQELRPTLFPSVPRLYNRLYDKVMAQINASGVKSWLFKKGMAAKMANLDNGIVEHAFWDKLLFGKIKAKLGGRIRLMATGSAPISPDLMAFLRCCFSCQVHEGYGQTETAAAATVTLTEDFSVGHVGPPLPCIEIKLAPVPEMGYLAPAEAKEAKKAGKKVKEGGEICFRGPCVFQGYYHNEKKTNEAIDEDGWLHSGDIGNWTFKGTLQIKDRVKHIFKLSQGEYVAPEKLEQVYVRTKYCAQMFVTGKSTENYVVAIGVLDPELVDELATEIGAKGASVQELCDNPKAKELIFNDLQKLAKDANLHGFEKPRKLTLWPELFSVDNGLLTPTFKNKRPILRDMFEQQINDMYA